MVLTVSDIVRGLSSGSQHQNKNGAAAAAIASQTNEQMTLCVNGQNKQSSLTSATIRNMAGTVNK